MTTIQQDILDSLRRHGWADVSSVACNQVLGGVGDMTRMKQARKQAAALLIDMADAGLIEQRGRWDSPRHPDRGGPSFHLTHEAPGHLSPGAAKVQAGEIKSINAAAVERLLGDDAEALAVLRRELAAPRGGANNPEGRNQHQVNTNNVSIDQDLTTKPDLFTKPLLALPPLLGISDTGMAGR